MKVISIVSRLAIEKPIYRFRAVVLWCVFIFYTFLQFDELYWFASLSGLDFAGLLAGMLSLSVCEIVLIALVAGLLKTGLIVKKNAVARGFFGLGLSILFFLVIFQVAVIIVGTAVYRVQGLMIDLNMVRAVFNDWSQFYRHLTTYELTLLYAGITTSVFIATAILLISPFRPTIQSCRTSLCIVGITLSCAFLVFRAVPAATKTSNAYSTFRGIAHNYLHPNVTVFWAPLIYSYSTSTIHPVDLDLVPLYSVDDYAYRVSKQGKRKNVLLFLVEALRYDVIHRSVNGLPVTPRLNRMAGEGALFSRVFAQSTESAYSMVSIVTGLHPLKFEHRDTYTAIHYPYMRIFDLLSATGYRTGFFSSANERWQNMIHFTKSDALDYFFHAESTTLGSIDIPTSDTGYQRAITSGRLKTGKLDDQVPTDELIGWIDKLETRRGKAPFFAAVSYQSSHFPYQQGWRVPEVFSPSDLGDSRQPVSFARYPEPLRAVLTNRYYNSLHYIDSLIARVVAKLEDKGIAEETVIIVAGDHGELFHEHGKVTHAGFLFNAAIHVPIIIWGVDPGRLLSQNSPAMLIDIAPTILALADLPKHDGFQGKPLVASRKGDAIDPSPARPLFATVQNIEAQDAVIIWPWKLIRDHRRQEDFFFHLARGPREARNLTADRPEITGCLRAVLAKFRSAQLYYYATRELYSRYFPPKFNSIEGICDKAVLAPSSPDDQKLDIHAVTQSHK